MSDDTDSPTAYSKDDQIIAKANDSVVIGDWQTMQQLAREILAEADEHKTDLQRAEEIKAAHIRLSCDNCDWEPEFENARQVRDRRATPAEHADHPDFDCTSEDVTVEAFCPRHGTIPLDYDACDTCASNRAVMNR